MNIELTHEQGIRFKLLCANNPFLLRSGPSGIDTTGSFLPPKRKINRWVVQQTDLDLLHQVLNLETTGANRRTVVERIECRIRNVYKKSQLPCIKKQGII